MNNRSIILSLVMIVILFFLFLFLNQDSNEVKAPKIKNLIVFIGDGLGQRAQQLASLYSTGEKNGLVLQQLPVKLHMAHSHAEAPLYSPKDTWSSLEILLANPTDSAAGGTAIATGTKTTIGTVGLDINQKRLGNLLEKAESLGKSTGVVTNSIFFDATPSTFSVHNEYRRNYSDIINSMVYESALEVIIGCGNPYYDNNGKEEEEPVKVSLYGGEEGWKKIIAGPLGADCDADGQADRWQFVSSREQFKTLATGETPKRLLGVLPMWSAANAGRDGIDDNIDDDLPYQTPRFEHVPTLAEMAAAALNTLDNNPRGFVVMIETEGTDETGHANQAGRMIEEILEFNQAIALVIDWVEKNSSWDETLLIITADHDTGGLIGPGNPLDYPELVNNGKGTIASHQWLTPDHSNIPVPIFARGLFSDLLEAEAYIEDPRFGSILDNTALGKFLKKIIALNQE